MQNDSRIMPFNDQHCDCLTEVIRSATSVEELLYRLEKCGLNVKDLQERNSDNKKVAENLKREFFPNRP